MPLRFCLKKTGPLDSNLIIIASKGINQESNAIITMTENTISNNLFINEFSGLCKGISLRESTGI